MAIMPVWEQTGCEEDEEDSGDKDDINDRPSPPGNCILKVSPGHRLPFFVQ